MNRFYQVISIATVLSILGCDAGKKVNIDDKKQRTSYAIGLDIGQRMKEQGVSIESPAFVAGLEHGLQGAKDPLLDSKALAQTLQDFRKDLMEERRKKDEEDMKKNEAEGKAFLDENAKKEGVKVLPSGLQYIVLSEGSGEPPKASDRVKTHYKGTLIDGTEFDSSYTRGEPATFALQGVIKGWTEALQLMKPGAKWKLFLPPDLGYGRRGSPPKIGPNATLVFEVELLEVVQPEKKTEEKK